MWCKVIDQNLDVTMWVRYQKWRWQPVSCLKCSDSSLKWVSLHNSIQSCLFEHNKLWKNTSFMYKMVVWFNFLCLTKCLHRRKYHSIFCIHPDMNAVTSSTVGHANNMSRISHCSCSASIFCLNHGILQHKQAHNRVQANYLLVQACNHSLHFLIIGDDTVFWNALAMAFIKQQTTWMDLALAVCLILDKLWRLRLFSTSDMYCSRIPWCFVLPDK